MSLNILTANDLRSGRVVYYTSDDEWSIYITDAQLARDEFAAERLASKGEQAESSQLVVGAYLIEVDSDYDIPVPVRFREQLRVAGPSVHQAFKKPTTNIHQ